MIAHRLQGGRLRRGDRVADLGDQLVEPRADGVGVRVEVRDDAVEGICHETFSVEDGEQQGRLLFAAELDRLELVLDAVKLGSFGHAGTLPDRSDKREARGYHLTMGTVAYMTHPLGERDAGEGMAWGDNMANAMSWFRFMVQATRWAICCPWYAYAVAVQDVFFRPRMLVDQVELVGRCDLFVMVGGRVSPHMRIELVAAQRTAKPIPVLNLLDLGDSPPWEQIDQVGQEIRRRTAALDLDD